METPVSEPVLTPVQIPEPKTKSSIVYLVLSFFILVFLVSTAFLYYQNMQLKKMLANYQTQPTVSPTPIAYQSPVPTTGPTANWKAYMNQHGSYQYSYPNNWKSSEPCPSFTGLECGDGPQNGSNVSDPNSKYPDGVFTVEYYDSSYCITEPELVKKYSWKDMVEKNITISGINATLLQGKLDFNDNLDHDRRFIFVTHGNTCYVIHTWSYQNPNLENIFDQILSTFKFTK